MMGGSDETTDAVDLLPVLRQRWSPREFDPAHTVTPAQVEVLLEAARWAPSAGNSQPWAFHVLPRGADGRAAVEDCLAPSSAAWAPAASLLVVNLAHTLVEDTDWEYSEFAAYDLGQAVAHLTIQAHAMGLSCRQFRAFDKDRLTALLQVPDHWEIITMTAVGRAAPTAQRGPRASERAASITWPRAE